MAIINSNYSTILPAQADAAGELSGITARAHAQITTPHAYLSNSSASNIDWTSLGEVKSHQMITLQKNTNLQPSDGLDSLVSTILTHIAKPNI